jgi:hypothetical protein
MGILAQDRFKILALNLIFEFSVSNGCYYIIERDKMVAHHILRCANSIGLVANIEEVPLSLTVRYFKIKVDGAGHETV